MCDIHSATVRCCDLPVCCCVLQSSLLSCCCELPVCCCELPVCCCVLQSSLSSCCSHHCLRVAVVTVFIPTRASSAHKRLSKYTYARARANSYPPVCVYTYPCVLKKQRGTRKSARAARHSAGRLVCVLWVSLVCDIHMCMYVNIHV